MMVLRKANHTKLVHLSALLIPLFFSLASLVGCDQPAPPQYVSLNLGSPAAALQSPVKGPLPETTMLHVRISFKVNPQVLNLVGQRPPNLGSPPTWSNSPGVSALTMPP